MKKIAFLFGLVVAIFGVSTTAHAQTHCMRSGSMMTCTGPNGMETIMITGDTGDQYDAQAAQQGQPAVAQGLADLFRGFGERRMRRRIGEMLANGDCRSAVEYAYSKGRIELGQSLASECQSLSARPRIEPPKNLPYDELVAMVERAADVYQPNFDIGEGMFAIAFEADEGTLRVISNLSPESNPESVKRIVCQNTGMQSVVVFGGTLAIVMGDEEIRITRGDCGI